MTRAFLVVLFGLGCAYVYAAQEQKKQIIVASKNFNESYLLAEIMSQTLEIHGYDIERKFGLGGTLITFEALVEGEIDVYPEYTGTVSQVILKLQDKAPSIEELNRLLVESGLQMSGSFGFNNTYAISIKRWRQNLA